MRKQFFILSAVLFSSINFLSAQITFQKTYGGTNDEETRYVRQTTDGGYIIAGYTNSFGAGGYDIYIVKTDTIGDTLWTKTFGGTGDDYGFSVQQTTDGGYIITGATSSFGVGLGDVYLIKTDANGDSVWTKTIGGVNQDWGNCVQQTMDGGYIVSGLTVSFASGVYCAYIIKTNSNGDTLWTKAIRGIHFAYGYAVQQTTDGGYIISASWKYGVAALLDFSLIKTDATGSLLWTKTYGGATNEEAYSVQQTTDGGYIIAGWTGSFGAGNYDAYLIKTDLNGDTLWTKTFGETNMDIGKQVQQTTDGGYIIVGYTASFGAGDWDVYLIKTDSVGNITWTKTFGEVLDDKGISVQQTTDGGYIVAGLTKSFGAGATDIYLIKTDANGNSGCNQGNSATIVSATATQVINPATVIFSGGTATFPHTIIGSGSFINSPCSVSINEIEPENSFLIFPNPSSGNFIISFKVPIIKGATIEILNILGEKVYSVPITIGINESKKEISLKNISEGIYFVKVYVYPDEIGNGEKYYCRKIIIEQD